MSGDQRVYRAKASFSCLVRGYDEADAASNLADALRGHHLLFVEDDSVRNVIIQTNGQYHETKVAEPRKFPEEATTEAAETKARAEEPF
jgi:hypothetical protein